MGAITTTPSRLETLSQIEDDHFSVPNVPMHLCVGPLLSKQTSEIEETLRVQGIFSILPDSQTDKSIENTILDESRETPSWCQPQTQQISFNRSPVEQKLYLKKNRKSSKSKNRKKSKKSISRIDLDAIF